MAFGLRPRGDGPELWPVARPESGRPASIHSTQQPLLERRIAVDSFDDYFDILRLTFSQKIHKIVGQITRHVTDHESLARVRAERDSVRIASVKNINHQIELLPLFQAANALV